MTDENSDALDLARIPELSREIAAGQIEEEGGLPPTVHLTKISEQTMEEIRDVVALQYAGRTPEEIADRLGRDVNYDNILEAKYPAHFVRARTEHAKRLEVEVKTNLVGIRASLTRHGFSAVSVLAEIMADEGAAPGVRAKCARDILNLCGAGYSGQNDQVNKTTVNILQNFDSVTEVEPNRMYEVDGRVVDIEDDGESD